jgi:hypothetical protein
MGWNPIIGITIGKIMKSIFELAKHYVDQWENHDVHRSTGTDRVLYNNGLEPDVVALSYQVLEPSIGSLTKDNGVVIGIVDPALYTLISGVRKEDLQNVWGEDFDQYPLYYVFFDEPRVYLTFEEYKLGNPQFKEEFLEEEYKKIKSLNILAIPGNKIQWEEESQEQESSTKEEESSVKE